jgi:hypothetical protein
MKKGPGALLLRALEGSEVFVYSTVESPELLFRQVLLVFIADINASFLEGVDEGRIGANVRHGTNKNFADFGIGEHRFLLSTFLRLRHGQIVPPSANIRVKQQHSGKAEEDI